MRINVAVPEAQVTKPVLDAALEAVTRLDESLIRQGIVPLFDEAKHQVRWKPEPKGDEHFDHAALVLKRGWGDCDDMAPWKAASLRVTGKDPEADAVVRKSGHRKWHAVVDRSDGSQDDPSRETGMGSVRNPRPGVFGINGAVLPLMSGASSVIGEEFFHRPKIAMRPIRTDSGTHICGWEARVDMPWVRGVVGADDLAMATSARHNCSSEALISALEGAIRLAEESGQVSGEAIDRAEAIIDACDGAHWDDLAEVYGADVADETMAVVGGFFKKLSRGIKKVGKGVLKVATSKLGRGLISMVPGVGPAAAAALDMAGPALKKMIDKGGKRPGSKLAAQMKSMGATKLVKRPGLPAGPVRRVKASRVRRKKSRVVVPKKRRIVTAPGRAKGSGRIVTLSFPFPE
jgi:hypothetical protein